MKKLNRGFLFALTLHINAVAMLFQNKKVLSWYKKTILLSVFVSVLLLSLLFFSECGLCGVCINPYGLGEGSEKDF